MRIDRFHVLQYEDLSIISKNTKHKVQSTVNR